MKTRIGIFGSCISRDIFRSAHNNYKNDYTLVFDEMRSSLVSVMQKPAKYNVNDLYVNNGDVHSKVNAEFIEKDLNKNFYKGIKKGIDYLIIDIFFDVYFGILCYEDNIITNNEWSLQNTEFFRKLPDTKKAIKIEHYPQEFMEIWTKYCDMFFKYMNEEYPHVRIILNKVELVDSILNADGQVVKDEIYKKMVRIYNPLFRKLENYIQKNYDVDVVYFPEGITADENNIWGSGAMHFTKIYYAYTYLEIKNIILNNENKHLKRKINGMINSSSWKLTKPLRSTKQLLKNKNRMD